jgi:hypothetical protein
MMWSLFIQLSISQLKDLVSRKVFKKFIELFKCNNYAYYLSIILLVNLLFFPYYLRAILETIITITEILFILSYKIFFILCLNYILLHFFYIFQKELEIIKIENVVDEYVEESEESESDELNY